MTTTSIVSDGKSDFADSGTDSISSTDSLALVSLALAASTACDPSTTKKRMMALSTSMDVFPVKMRKRGIPDNTSIAVLFDLSIKFEAWLVFNNDSESKLVQRTLDLEGSSSKTSLLDSTFKNVLVKAVSPNCRVVSLSAQTFINE
uniref:Uncharacterized protein n=1 Tax=Romanomermis culicivorax TaxID=13658 RepID=A0A915JES4_ROMCU